MVQIVRGTQTNVCCDTEPETAEQFPIWECGGGGGGGALTSDLKWGRGWAEETVLLVSLYVFGKIGERKPRQPPAAAPSLNASLLNILYRACAHYYTLEKFNIVTP